MRALSRPPNKRSALNRHRVNAFARAKTRARRRTGIHRRRRSTSSTRASACVIDQRPAGSNPINPWAGHSMAGTTAVMSLRVRASVPMPANRDRPGGHARRISSPDRGRRLAYSSPRNFVHAAIAVATLSDQLPHDRAQATLEGVAST